MTDFSTMSATQLNDWYEMHVGYRPQVDDPSMSNADLLTLCVGVAKEHSDNDPHAICRKWVKRLGGGLHPDTRGKDYTPALDADEIKEYDADMEKLFACAADPYDCGVMAMADAGLC
jgi:hypothetical protein